MRFLDLPSVEQAAILQTVAGEIGRSAQVLEKDVWLCEVLNALFALNYPKRMAFKGGTSLSKVYKVIQRFSEDIDVSIDYRDMGIEPDPLATETTKSQARRVSDQLRDALAVEITTVIGPALKSELANRHADKPIDIAFNGADENISVSYPSAVGRTSGYLRDNILLEFGGRNLTEPSEEHEIVADAAERIPDLEFPRAKVTVLSAHRTYWEKVTLIHEKIGRGKIQSDASRLSRHWYDLAQLASSAAGIAALGDRQLLADVVKLKTTFFNAPTANYEGCLIGQLRLVPDGVDLNALGDDYLEMQRAGMFDGEPPKFDKIVDALRTLEAKINATAR
jgi:hypothetical protein